MDWVSNRHNRTVLLDKSIREALCCCVRLEVPIQECIHLLLLCFAYNLYLCHRHLFPGSACVVLGAIVCELGRLHVKLLAGVVYMYVKLHCHVRKNVFLSLASIVNLKLFSTIWLVGRWRTLRCWRWNRTCFYFSINMCWQHSLTLLDLFEVWRPTRCWCQRHTVNQA